MRTHMNVTEVVCICNRTFKKRIKIRKFDIRFAPVRLF